MKIIHEDRDLIVLAKPAGILVHETLAREKETIVKNLIKTDKINPRLSWPNPSRPGIVHRLDKDTSGLIVIAKTPKVLQELQQQFKNRQVKKEYIALVAGEVAPAEGKIEAAITRDKAGPQKVQVFNYSFSKKLSRSAVTFYETIGKYKFRNNILTLLKASPQTGRMHQIRLHLKYIGNPILGDPLYNTKLSRKISDKLNINRQFLHASKIEFWHPVNQKKMVFESSLPKELEDILVKLTSL